MNINSYEAKVIGQKLYITIAKKYNLFTQKWTIGRLKPFKEEIKNLLKQKLAKN